MQFSARGNKNTSKKKRDKLGFTLIELIVVIAIIGLLAAAAVANFTNVLPSVRDARRLGDIKNLITSLEQYHADQGYYPPYDDNSDYGPYYSDTLDWIPASPLFSSGGKYMQKAPRDPRQKEDWCTKYRYQRISCCSYYLEYGLESRSDDKAIGQYQGFQGGNCNRYWYRVTNG